MTTKMLLGCLLGLVMAISTFVLFPGPGVLSDTYSPISTGPALETGMDPINPETDLVYLGAFRLPDEESNGTLWSYGGHGMGYHPQGDPSGPADGHPGSLFAISHPYQNYVSEFSIPAPFITPDKNVDDLPLAKTLQPFADVTGGRQTGGLTGTTLGDVQPYLPQGAQTGAKLYWAMYEYYLPDPTERMFGWSELDLTDAQSQGLWRLDDFPSSATSKYLFDIPPTWSASFTPGKSLAAGRCRIVNGGSWGPALYAFGPWNDGSPPGVPPPDGASLDAVELLKYDSGLNLASFSHSDDWPDGAWLAIGEKSAVVFAGMRAMRTSASGEEYYGEPGVDGCGYKGYHGEPYYGTLLFYDAFLLAQVTRGVLQPDEVQPYAEYNVEDYMFEQGCRRGILGGVGYDRDSNLLYVAEKYVDGHYARKPVIHVWRLRDQEQLPDRTPPDIPTNLHSTQVSSSTVEFAWDQSDDNVHLAGYIIHRNGAPVATVIKPAYADDKVNPGTVYTYTVQAWDARSNRSAFSDPLTVTTGLGPDTRAPLISSFRITDIGSDRATASWRTDEPATSRVYYEILYSGDGFVAEDLALRTEHRIVLNGLTPGKQYSCSPASADVMGNEYQRPGWQFSTPSQGSGGYAPELDGIGAKRTDEGVPLQFTIRGDDLDDDLLLYSVKAGKDTGHLPPGASFDPDTRVFHWWPGPDDSGVYWLTFTVSDGQQSDSQDVAVFVLDTLGGPLELTGRPGDRTIHLDWTLNLTLPVTSTWQIDYQGSTADQPSPITGIVSPSRTYDLTGLTNYEWYTVTLSAMVSLSSVLSDSVRVRPTDIILYLPLIIKED